MSPSIPPYSLIRAHGKGWTALGPQGIQSRPGFVSSFIQNITTCKHILESWMFVFLSSSRTRFRGALPTRVPVCCIPGNTGGPSGVVRPKTRRRHSLQHAAPHQDSSHVLVACVSQCKMICECNIPRYLITETPPRSTQQQSESFPVTSSPKAQ